MYQLTIIPRLGYYSLIKRYMHSACPLLKTAISPICHFLSRWRFFFILMSSNGLNVTMSANGNIPKHLLAVEHCYYMSVRVHFCIQSCVRKSRIKCCSKVWSEKLHLITETWGLMYKCQIMHWNIHVQFFTYISGFIKINLKIGQKGPYDVHTFMLFSTWGPRSLQCSNTEFTK